MPELRPLSVGSIMPFEGQNSFKGLIGDISYNFGALEDMIDLIMGTEIDFNHTHQWEDITDPPTTISGYGITDAYTRTEADNLFTLPSRLAATPENVTNLNTITESGWYRFSAGSTGAPFSFTGVVHHITFSDIQAVQYARSHSAISEQYERVNVSGTWGPWYKTYSASNIVGTVSRTGSIPTGAIIERGGNANGQYIRYADGTQICWKSDVTFTKNSTRNEITWTFPAVFSETPSCWTNMNGRTVDGGNGREAYTMCALSSNLASTGLIITLITGSTAQSGSWSLNQAFAIGRWY